MLPKQLLRYRIEGDHVVPSYITRKQSPHYLRIAEKLIDIYERHLGKTRRELDDKLMLFEGERLNYKVVRGLANILDKNIITGPADEEKDYEKLRERLFAQVEKHRPVVRSRDLLHTKVKDHVIADVSPGITGDDLQMQLYGDLKANHIIKDWERKTSPETLLRRYNLQLAQGILYRAESMTIRLHDSYKIVFRYLKLSRLMHRIYPLENGYGIYVDGPLSLFSRTIKYGIHLAKFLPGLLLAEKWDMRASIRLRDQDVFFPLNQDCGLHSHYRDAHPFDSSVEEMFYKKFQKAAPNWQIEREADIINLGDTVLIPDFTLISPEGKKFLLEIIGFWTPEYLSKKLEKINAANREDLILVVNQQLNCSREDFRGKVIFFKNRIDVVKVVDNLKTK
ncbi:DUF790 family protein [candidate division KSB1 bacterium]|nr:DUF790 family protein [candidate division KSB1 bacterium]